MMMATTMTQMDALRLARLYLVGPAQVMQKMQVSEVISVEMEKLY